MIDLHTHTTASDGTVSPAELVEAACKQGLEALAITDHDTLAGYDEAAPVARSLGLNLVCGIELSTRLPRTAGRHGRSVHLLGYFLHEAPGSEFIEWLRQVLEIRRDRNRRMVARLNELGVAITMDEVESVGGHLTGRPHFARVLVRKGYVTTFDEAFEMYLDESAKAYVQRIEPSVPEAIWRIRHGGGIAVVAHPGRLGLQDPAEEEALVRWMRDEGLQGIEVFYPDHDLTSERRYWRLAERYGLRVTGGSDFHGSVKADIHLGTGRGNLSVSAEVLRRLRESTRANG